VSTENENQSTIQAMLKSARLPANRVVMAPITRSRSKRRDGIPVHFRLEYYCQRASDGGLILAEAAQSASGGADGWEPGMDSAARWRVAEKDRDVCTQRVGVSLRKCDTGVFSHVTHGGATPVCLPWIPVTGKKSSGFVVYSVGWLQPSPTVL